MELFNSLLFMLNEMSPYILLGFLIAGVMHAFIPQAAFARHLSGTGWRAVVKSALIGIPLPLCSCGVLPTAIAMRRNGASRAASTSFLVATPQTGVDSISATWSLLGPAFAVIRPIAALVTAVFGGLAVGRAEGADGPDGCDGSAHPHGHTNSHSHPECGCMSDAECESPRGFAAKSVAALKYGFVDLVSSIGGWLVAGLIIAAVITVYVPDDFFAVLGKTPIFSMIAVLVVAIPMYVCATGSIPIAMSLMLKGLSPGTALVLLMAGPAANFASFTLVSREMGRKAASIYLAAIIAGSVAFGLAIDYLMPASWFSLGHIHAGCAHGHGVGLFQTICSGILVALLAASFIRRNIHKHITIQENMTKEYQISGMNCPHCQATVQKSISGVKGVRQVEVILSSGKAIVEGDQTDADVISAVRAAGFDASL